MKKRMLAVMLPVAAFVALAGTGFGVWVFQTNASASASADYVVTDAVTIDAVSCTVTGSLKLDQEKAVGSDNYESISDDNNSISLALSADYNGLAGQTGEATGNDYTYTPGSAETKIKYNYHIVTSVTGSIATYVKASTVNGVAFSVDGNDIAMANVNTDLLTKKDVAVKFAWVSTKKPTTMAEYKTMVDALAAKDSKITFTITVTSLAAVAA